jgi:Spy/CpxP family protein refolding chaperone
MKWNKQALILSGAVFFGLALHAQSANPGTPGADTARRSWTRHEHGPRIGNDSLHRREGWRTEAGRPGMGPKGQDWTGDHRDGQGFGEDRRGRHGFAGRSGMGHGHRPMLHYTPEQRQQMIAISKDYRKRSADLFLKDITLKEYRAGLIALQKERKSKLQALLTPQQKEELAKWKARAAENAQVMAAARLERLKIRLSLSDEQVAKVKAGQASLKAQAKSIHENEDLLPRQKMEQLKDLMAKRDDAIRSVLTPEQLSKFQEMHKGRERRAQYPGRHRTTAI